MGMGSKVRTGTSKKKFPAKDSKRQNTSARVALTKNRGKMKSLAAKTKPKKRMRY